MPAAGARGPAACLAHSGDEGFDQSAVAPAFLGFLGQDLKSRPALERFSVGPLCRQRVEHIDDPDNLRQQWDLAVS